MTMPEKLKACPFCGSNESVNDGHFVGCDNCGAAGPCKYPVPDADIAAELWNRRAGETK
jgi:transcription elongation factor Elf1